MVHNIFLSAFLCQLLAVLAFAAPIADEALSTAATQDAWEYGTTGGVVGFIVLVLDVIGIIEVLKSNRGACSKLLWILVIFFFPLVGMLFYYLFSNRAYHNSSYEQLP